MAGQNDGVPKGNTRTPKTRESVRLDDVAQDQGEITDVSQSRPEKVRLDELPSVPWSVVKEAGPMPAIGLLLALVVVGYVVMATVGLFVYGWAGSPKMPDPASLTPSSVTLWKELLAQWHTHVSELSKLLIKDTALPVLLAILGYIFGSRERLRRPAKGGERPRGGGA